MGNGAHPLGQSVAVHFQGTSAAVMGGMFLAGLGVESYMLGQVILIHRKPGEQAIFSGNKSGQMILFKCW